LLRKILADFIFDFIEADGLCRIMSQNLDDMVAEFRADNRAYRVDFL